MNEDEMLFIHSRCHCKHWELVYDKHTKQYDLQCEVCGKSVGPEISISGPSLQDCECEVCKMQRKNAPACKNCGGTMRKPEEDEIAFTAAIDWLCPVCGATIPELK